MIVARATYLLSLALLGAYYPKFGRYPNYDWLAFAAVLSVGFVYAWRMRMPRLHPSIITSCILFAIGATLTNFNASGAPSEAFSALLLLYMFGLWLPLATLVFTEWKHLRWAYTALAVTVAVTVGYAIGQRVLGWPFLGHEIFAGRMTGLTRHPNELGVLCGIAFPFPLCLAVTARRRTRQAFSIAVALLALLGIVLSGSMTGAAALLCSGASYWILTTKKARFRTTVLALIGGVAVAGATAAFSGSGANTVVKRLDAFLASSAGKYTLEQRLIGDRNAWFGIEREPLLGHGYHSRVATLGGEIAVHNTELRAWYDGGLFTLVGMLTVLGGAAVTIARALRTVGAAAQAADRAYVAAAASAFVALVVAMQVSPVLYQRSAWAPAALAFAVASVVRRKRGRPSGSRGWEIVPQDSDSSAVESFRER